MFVDVSHKPGLSTGKTPLDGENQIIALPGCHSKHSLHVEKSEYHIEFSVPESPGRMALDSMKSHFGQLTVLQGCNGRRVTEAGANFPSDCNVENNLCYHNIESTQLASCSSQILPLS